MTPEKKEHPKEKQGLHSRSKHKERYDFKALMASSPELAPYVRRNEYGDESIDFFRPDAVKALNKALLKYYYEIQFWDIPAHYLCPPIPGRADYLHHLADLLYGDMLEMAKLPNGSKIRCLDVGVGANCVYPLIGYKEYGWQFVGSDIDPVALASAQNILDKNPSVTGKVELRKQLNPKDIFRGVIKEGEVFDVTLCNPPFHASLAEARLGTVRKLRNLKQQNLSQPSLNFGGMVNELWCEGGEEKFVSSMIHQSKHFSTSSLWFSTLVSKEAHLYALQKALKKSGAVEVKTVTMHQGNKTSRLLAWTFFSAEQQRKWKEAKWV